MIYAKGISWLDDTRIPFVDEIIKLANHKGDKYASYKGKEQGELFYSENTKGRFTPNLLVCDDMLNDGSVSKSGSNRKVKQYKPLITQAVKMGGGDKNNEPSDKGTNSRYYNLDLWFNKMVDEL